MVASRLPVDRVEGPDGETEWQTSPGGLVTALEPVMREHDVARWAADFLDTLSGTAGREDIRF